MGRTLLRNIKHGDRLSKVLPSIVAQSRRDDRELTPEKYTPPLEYIGEIVATGPQGEPDFSLIPKYWVKVRRVVVADAAAQIGDYPAEVQAAVPHVAAYNLAELKLQTRDLLPGEIVVIREIFVDETGPGEPPTNLWVFNRSVGGGGTVQEVAIACANALLGDCVELYGQPAIDAWNTFGPHLIVCPKTGVGEPTCEGWLVAFPNWDHGVCEFKGPGCVGQIYNAATSPIFTAVQGSRGLTLATFGEGEIWVPAPDPADICGGE